MKPVKTYTNNEPHYVMDNPMNAYELAEIMTTHDGSLVWEHGLEIATMLRQQADQLDKVIPQLVKANGLIENLRIKIVELEELLKAYREDNRK